MSLKRHSRERPEPWRVYRATVKRGWTLPFHSLEWIWQWTAFLLSRWVFLEVLEHLSTFSVLVAVIFYFTESGDRKKQKHYQAWQVINTAQGKGGSGGRIEALQELNKDGVPLVGVNAAGAFLQGVRLRGAKLLRCNFEAADMRNSDLSGSTLEFADLKSANFREADLHDADLQSADLSDVDMVGANLRAADLAGATLNDADLRNADLSGVRWQSIASMEKANIYGVRNAPQGFVAWALEHKAVSEASPKE